MTHQKWHNQNDELTKFEELEIALPWGLKIEEITIMGIIKL